MARTAAIPASTAALLVLALLAGVRGHPSGYTACGNVPGHSSRADATGFTVTLRNAAGAPVTAWTAGQTYTVTMARSGGAFRGFVAAVFPGASWGGDYGAAKAGALSAGANSRAGGCGGVTHASRADKTTATWTWAPPARGTGAVSFYATAVIGYSSSWMQVTQTWPEAAAPAVSRAPTASRTKSRAAPSRTRSAAGSKSRSASRKRKLLRA